ncbi:MAG: UDP-N-acetylglucosamine--N-acetylmuramyl-(pentapeptide) pyrophosphoryl-undecaprenol N-acetylglucosamine transferase [Candidatus Delongbacteria bacterium]|nr:UDP-N-acetylglucosamine--N-acetylmuramyl-(pentapeptide) pyrophosphoryl-undecaprenol N-acetylglucosamine transferase [Candidatus Delongbacteria bacterium]
MKKLRICFTGGGTGGHIYPALTLYQILKKNHRVESAIYLGNRDKAEGTIIPKTEIPLKHIASTPFAGTSLQRKIIYFLLLLRGMQQSLWNLIRYRPHLIIATGGYVSAPVVFSAFFLKPFIKCRIIIQEQNVVPGVFNKFASIFADLVLVSFKESAFYLWSNRCFFSGYPLRDIYLTPRNPEEIRRRLGIPPHRKVVLSYGGSMGARTINEVFPTMVRQLATRNDLYLVHITGMSKHPYNAYYQTMMGLKEQAAEWVDIDTARLIKPGEEGEWGRILEYSHDLYDYQTLADIILTRAGAGAVAELSALGKPTILIPKWGLSGDHQELNAFTLADRKACRVSFEKKNPENTVQVDHQALMESLFDLLNSEDQRHQLSHQIRHFFVHDFEYRTISAIENLFQDPNRIEYLDQVLLPDFVSHILNFDLLVQYLGERVKEGNTDHFLVVYYRNRLNEFLQTSNWEVENKAIKLAGALHDKKILLTFAQRFGSLKGFQRRNLLTAISRTGFTDKEFLNLIIRALDDRYFEVRREAVHLLKPFYPLLKDHRDIKPILTRIVRNSRESFEVISALVIVLPFYCEESEFYPLVQPFQTHPSVKIRESLLEALYQARTAGLLKDAERLAYFVKNIFITSSHFTPQFGIRAKYKRIMQILEEDSHD